MLESYNKAVKFAWHDKKSFEEIKRILGFSESNIIHIMRKNLNPRSFKIWRRRVKGRRSKHQKKSELQSKFENYKININEIF